MPASFFFNLDRLAAMPILKQVSLINRFKPERSGTKSEGSPFYKHSNTLLEVTLPPQISVPFSFVLEFNGRPCLRMKELYPNVDTSAVGLLIPTLLKYLFVSFLQ